MSVEEYKEAIKSLVDSTKDENLLRHWKTQLEIDIQGYDVLSAEEWNLVQEGIAAYQKGDVISLEEFKANRE